MPTSLLLVHKQSGIYHISIWEIIYNLYYVLIEVRISSMCHPYSIESEHNVLPLKQPLLLQSQRGEKRENFLTNKQ